MMLRYELLTALKSRRALIFFLFFICITSFDLYQNYTYNFGRYLEGIVAAKPTGKDLFHPCFASFVSASHIGRLPQILMTWVFPLYPLFAYADSFVIQKQCGYYNVLLTKMNRKSVVSSRLATAFLIPFIVVMIALVLNFAVASIVFKGGTSFAVPEEALRRGDVEGLSALALLHPYSTYIIHILVFSLVIGLYGMFCAAVTFFVPKYIVLYPVIFFVWISMMNLPYMIFSVMHSFTTYNVREMIISSIYYTLLVLLTTVAAYIYKVKCDEL